MARSGYIKLHRQISDHWLWNNGEPFDKRSAWIDLLMLANWEDATIVFNGQVTHVERGQLMTTIGFLAKRWKWSDNKVRRFMADLRAEGMVRTNGRPNGRANGRANGTLITIEKYAFFQGGRRTDGRANGRTDGRTDGRQKKKNKEEYKETRAREGSVDEPSAALEEVETEAMPDWFKNQIESTFGKM